MSSRPAAPEVAYPPQEKPILDTLEDVLYAKVQRSVTVSVSIGSYANASLAIVQAASRSVWNGLALGPLLVLPGTDDSGPEGSLFQPSSNGSASAASGVRMSGMCTSLQDLLALPIVSYVSEVAELEPMFTLMENGDLVMESNEEGYFGLIDPMTGVAQNWTANSSAPIVSEVGWLVYNCFEENTFRTQWYAHIFHEFPRMVAGASNFFVYSVSPSSTIYLEGAVATGVPFVAIGLLLLFLSPILALVRFASANVLRRYRRRNLSKRLKGDEKRRFSPKKACRYCCSVRVFNMFSSNGSSLSRNESEIVKERMKQAHRIKGQILRNKKRLDLTLSPSSIGVRAFLIFLLTVLLLEVPLGFILFVGFDSNLLAFFDEISEFNKSFENATEAANQSLSAVIELLNSCENSNSTIASVLREEEGLLENILSLVDPTNVILSDLNFIDTVDTMQTILWIVLNLVLAFGTIAAMWSLVLTYCRFTWSEDQIICTRVSSRLGCCVRPFLIVISAFSWVVLGALCALLTVLADICEQPSFVQVNTSIANVSSTGEEQFRARIYEYKREFMKEFPIRNGSFTIRSVQTIFNPADFVTSCWFTNALFNPYTYEVRLANEIHQVVANSQEVIDECGVSGSGPYFAPAFYDELEIQLRCAHIGESLGDGVTRLCQTNFSALFVYFVSLIAFNVAIVVVVQNHREMLPNIYRMQVARRLENEIMQEQTELREVLHGPRNAYLEGIAGDAEDEENKDEDDEDDEDEE